jgi:hypothetical protein
MRIATSRATLSPSNRIEEEHMNRIPFVFATAVVATAAGCGSQASPTLTKAQMISRGTAICKHAEREVNALPQLTTQHPFAPGTSSHERRTARTFLVGYAKALDDSRTGLAKLKAPNDGKELLDAYLSGIGKVAAELRAAANAPDPQVESAAGKAFTLFDSVSANTASYGFGKGVCASGSSS